MKLTIQKYYTLIKASKIVRSKLPAILQKGWDYTQEVTQKGASFETYKNSEIVRRTIDLYLDKIEIFLASKKVDLNTRAKQKVPTKMLAKKAIKRTNDSKSVIKKTESQSRMKPQLVETISIELKFLRRYLNLDQKAKTKRQIRLFLNALQRAIIEKKIRKQSNYAPQIERLQRDLIALINSFGKNEIMQVLISRRKQNEILKLLGKEMEIPSVKLIREYISLQGKPVPAASAKRLHNKIARKVNAGFIGSRDKYADQINQILKHLKALVEDNPIGGELTIEKRQLKGLNGLDLVIENTNSNRIPDDQVINSMDLVKMKFDKYEFKKQWFDFIGNPSRSFNVMIFGKPKFGKSILAVDFAGYLARNHGTVIYVAKEEGIDEELREKLESVAHPDLDAVASIPTDLSRWDFIFFDSVNKLRLSPEDLEGLREKYPNKSFISIFQSTKDGAFRGSQEFMHDMDVVIEVPEKGKAVQTGRYNQGGELDIFKNKK